jgi:class 3 adenylate cyclase
LQLRIGIHLGDGVEEGDGDLMGDGVNVAARIEAITDPAGISFSHAAMSAFTPESGHRGRTSIPREGHSLDYHVRVQRTKERQTEE